MSKTCLIGHTGFVGGNLLRVRDYDACFNTTNIHEIRGRHFGLVVCAAPQAQKWWANLHPEQDLAIIDALIDHLQHVRAERFVLISTIDVFPIIKGVDESFDCASRDNHAYGRNRLHLESFVAERFARHHIVRLPGLFGPGLKKNVIYDLLNDNQLDKINPDGEFQWYDLTRLQRDLDRVVKAEIRLVVLATEPVPVHEIQARFFPRQRLNPATAPGARYAVRSQHAEVLGGREGYIRSAAEVLEDMGRYIDRERQGGA